MTFRSFPNLKFHNLKTMKFTQNIQPSTYVANWSLPQTFLQKGKLANMSPIEFQSYFTMNIFSLSWHLNHSSWPTLNLGRKSRNKRLSWCSKKRKLQSSWTELYVHLMKYYLAVVKNKVDLYIYMIYDILS